MVDGCVQPKVLAGLVLAGGRSLRFGSEKAMARLGSRLLIEWTVSILAGVASATAINARPESEASDYAKRNRWPLVHDNAAAAAGPLAGISAGLAWASSVGAASLVTMPCDVPFVSPEKMRLLASAEGAACLETSRGIEGLCAIWPVSAAHEVAGYLKQKVHPSVREVLKRLDAKSVYCEGQRDLININTRADLEEAAAWLERRSL